jgi:sugar phosphate permease
LALSFVVAISYSCYDVLEMFYVRDTLHSGFAVYTALLVLYGTGLLITATFVMRHTHILSSDRALGPIVVFLGLSEVAYVLTDRLWVCSTAAVLLGVAAALFAPMCRASLLAATPVGRHGATMAAWRSTQSAGNVIPPLAIGAIGQAVGSQPTMIATATLVIVAGLAAWPIRVRRRTGA